jgi:hypothetical protein
LVEGWHFLVGKVGSFVVLLDVHLGLGIHDLLLRIAGEAVVGLRLSINARGRLVSLGGGGRCSDKGNLLAIERGLLIVYLAARAFR